MKLLLAVLCLISVAAAAPGCTDPRTNTLRVQPALQHDEVRDEFGQYAFRYVTAEGTIVSQRGHLVPNPDGCGEVLVIEGETSYIGDDGKTYKTKYTAGLDGFHAEGDHLPVPVTADIPVDENSRYPNYNTNERTSFLGSKKNPSVEVAPAPKRNPCVEVVTSAPAPKKNPCAEVVPAPKRNPCVEVTTSAPAPKRNPCVEVAPAPKRNPCVEVATSAPAPKRNPCVEVAPAPKRNPCVEVATSAPAWKRNPCKEKINPCE